MKLRIFFLFAILVSYSLSFAQDNGEEPQLDIVVFGDSNVWLGGDDCDQPKGWISWFKKAIQPNSMRSYARSGATWTSTVNTTEAPDEYTAVLDDNNVIYNQVIRFLRDLDNGSQVEPTHILISAGANDMWFSDKRPGYLDYKGDFNKAPLEDFSDRKPNELLTMAEAIFWTFQTLRTRLPYTQIILLTPPQLKQIGVDDLHNLSDHIEKYASVMGCPVMRLDKEGPISQAQEMRQNTYTYDGTHTNEVGARKLGHYIARKFRTLQQD